MEKHMETPLSRGEFVRMAVVSVGAASAPCMVFDVGLPKARAAPGSASRQRPSKTSAKSVVTPRTRAKRRRNRGS